MYPYPPQYQPPKPSSSRLGSILALVGGLVAGLSFFLPFVSFFGFNENLLTLATVQQNPPPNQYLYLIPAFMALTVTLCAAVTLLERAYWLHLVPFTAALIGLVVLGFIIFQFTNASSSSSSFTAITNYLSTGFYGTAGGFLLGCIGSVIELFR